MPLHELLHPIGVLQWWAGSGDRLRVDRARTCIGEDIGRTGRPYGNGAHGEEAEGGGMMKFTQGALVVADLT